MTSTTREAKPVQREALLHDNERLAATLDAIGDGLIVTGASGEIVLLNRTAEKLCGWTNEEAQVELFRDVVRVVDAHQQPLCPVLRVLKGAQAGAAWCVAIQAKNGSTLQIEGSAAPQFYGLEADMIGTIFVFRDVSTREETQVELKHSTQRYASLMQAISQITWTTPADGRVEDIPSWREYTGQSMDEIRGWGWLDAIHPDDRERVAQVWNDCQETSSFYQVEYRIRRRDGVYRSFLVRGVPVLESDGSIREWVGACSDIHERKQAEWLLFEQRRVLEMIARGEPLGITLKALARIIQSHSQSPCSVHVVEGEYLRNVATAQLPIEYSKSVERILIADNTASCGTAAFRNQIVVVEDIENDASWRDFKQFATPYGLRACWSMPIVGGDEVLGTFAMYDSEVRSPRVDELNLLKVAANLAGLAIERERTEGFLLSSLTREARSATELSSILSRITDGVLTADANGTITFENDAARQMHGMSMLGYNLRDNDLVPPLRDLDGHSVSSENSPLARAVFRGEEVCDEEIFVTRADNSEITVEANAVSVRSDDGVQLGAVLTIRDVTAQRQIIRDMLEASRSKDEFLAILSHELRTPLTPILGWTSLLRQIDRDDEVTFQQAVDAIERNAKLQKRLVNDLLDTTRIVSNKLQIEKRSANLNELVRLSVRSVQDQANEQEVRIEYSIDENLPAILFDTERIQQVLMNLLSNAIKFSSAGGKISICTQLHKKFDQTSSTRYALIEVCDSGQGIAPELLPHIFDLFRQGDSSFTRRHGGLGLGLAICKSLVEMHGGTIQALSEGLGRGAIFRVLLPIENVTPQFETEL